MDFVDIGLYGAYALFFVGLVAAIALPLVGAISNPKSLMKIGVGVGSAIGLYLIAYLISGSEVTTIYTNFGVDSGDSKMIGGGLIMVYLLGILAIGGIIFSEVSRLIK